MISRTLRFISAIYVEKAVIYELAKRDFQQQYMGSYLGFVWVFLQPLLFITVLYPCKKKSAGRPGLFAGSIKIEETPIFHQLPNLS